jgi:hypothetical protein
MPMDFPHVYEAIVGTFLRYGFVINVPSTLYISLGIESRWGRDFPYPSTLALVSTQLPAQRIPGLLPGGKATGE